jgi:prophage maintenance system killer protein
VSQAHFLSLAEILALYDEAMALSDQPRAALVRPDDLDRAVHHPRVLAWYESATLAELAVDVGLEIALAHAFVDGNKRLAALATLTFLDRNHVRVPLDTFLSDYADAFVATVGALPNERLAHASALVEMVQRWVDASAPS